MIDHHRETVLAVHTHTQRAQPTTVAHYLLAGVEQLERDAVRLKAAYERTNRNPLGSCAITGTGFPIDRQLTSELLGFCGPTGNTYGSIATVDYLLESTSAAAVLLAGHGRFVQDLLLWCTAEFDYIRFGDGFVQSSSIMPQKRNPVAIEHARAIGSKALGQAQAIVLAVHNTPFGDIVDTEDDLQPLVFSMFRDATRSVKLVAAAMRTAEFDADRLEKRAADGWTTLTELADTLVRDHGLSFKTAHRIAGGLMAARQRQPARPLTDLLAEVSGDVLGVPLVLLGCRADDHPEPSSLRQCPQDVRWSGARGDGPRVARLAPAARGRRSMVERRDERAGRGGATACRAERRAVTSTAIRVILLEAAIIRS